MSDDDNVIDMDSITDEEFLEIIKNALESEKEKGSKNKLKSNVIDIFTKEEVDPEFKQYLIDKNANFERMVDQACGFNPPPVDGVLITINEKGSMHILNTFGNMKETIHMIELAKLRLLQSNG